jgi:hypothetical protein
VYCRVVERIDLLGSAVFLLFTGAGRWSADWELGRAKEASLEQIGPAVWSLRVMAGLRSSSWPSPRSSHSPTSG